MFCVFLLPVGFVLLQTTNKQLKEYQFVRTYRAVSRRFGLPILPASGFDELHKHLLAGHLLFEAINHGLLFLKLLFLLLALGFFVLLGYVFFMQQLKIKRLTEHIK